MDLNLGDNSIQHLLNGYEYGWTCAICLIPAVSGVILEFQYLEFHHIEVFTDTDNTSWV